MDADERIQLVEAVEQALAGGPAVIVATVVAAGEVPGLAMGAKLLVRRDGSRLGSLDGGPVDDLIGGIAEDQFSTMPRVVMQTAYVHREGGAATRRSQARPGDGEVMVQLFEAPVRLVIVGGGHVGLAIAKVAELAGFDVTVIDDRPEFANRERFPMAETVICGAVDEALAGERIDEQTYIVLVSRGHQVDEVALRATAGRGAAYLGMIGSRRRTATVLRHLQEDGYAADALAAVHTPIGLDIHAETPEEIAVSIVAEMVMVRRGGSGRPLSSLESRRQAEQGR